MPFKDKDAQREYQRNWMAQRRAEFFKGKRCVQCDSASELELDHKNPTEKIAHAIWSWSDQRRSAELAKCQVLCSSCHHKKTEEQRPITNGYVSHQHGTVAMYRNHKCKCSLCKKANTEDVARRRKNRKTP